MTPRASMLAAMRGTRGGRTVFAPRMDLWAIALRARGTLPAEYDGTNTAELADAFGVGCHAVRADYTLPRDPGDLVLRGLGFDNHPDYPFRVEIEGLEVRFETTEEGFSTTVTTSSGPVDWSLAYTAEMARAGVSLPFVESYPAYDAGDLDRLAEVFEHLVVRPAPGSWERFSERVGKRGVAVANGCIVGSPMHLLLHELMPIDRFFYAYHDEYDRLAAFAERVEPFFERMLAAVAASPAEVVLWGGNYDRDVTWPPFFDSEIAPWLRRVGAVLGEAGKVLLCHTDGENEGLTEGYVRAGFDVAESVCPAPMTGVALGSLRERMGPAICIWGGVPSVMLLRDSVSDADFDSWLARLTVESARTDDDLSPLILGVSDNVPPDADLDRLRAIADAFRP